MPIDLGSCIEIGSGFSSIGEGSNYILSESEISLLDMVFVNARALVNVLTFDLAKIYVNAAVPFRDNTNRAIMKHKPAEYVSGHCCMSHRDST